MNPENDQKLCDSRNYWWPDIKRAAERFEASLNKRGGKNSIFVQLDISKLESALEMYERGWWTFKEHVYGESAKEGRIDRHKIISLYILSFLAKRPFSARINPQNEDKDKRLFFLANELFSLAIMQELIFAWNEKDKRFKMGENERDWFIILLNHFKLKFAKSNPKIISDNPSDMADFLSLAQIVYYIEKSHIG